MKVLWEDDVHQYIWLGHGDPAEERGITSNQFLILDGGECYLLDPGGYHVFGRVFSNTTSKVGIEDIKGLFFSHQDPDVIASLVSWLEIAPEATVYVSRLWERFIAHLALPTEPKLHPLVDHGETVTLKSGSKIHFVPAHFLHSPGNFMVYDERSKILFTGDAGAAVATPSEDDLFVTDFESYAKQMEGFHRRYVPCNQAVKNLIDKIKDFDIQMLTPQHGKLMRGDHVGQFVRWISTLDVGVDFTDWGKPR